MHHAIYPIYIEDQDILIRSINELKVLKKNDQETFCRVVSSSDALRMCKAFALDQSEIEEICKLDTSTTQNAELLVGKRYKASELIANNDRMINISGYHRHKSILECEEKEISLEHDAVVKFCTIIGCEKIFIRSGTHVSFQGVVFDGVTLVVEDGATVGLNDVEISGSAEYGCRVNRGGIINHFENVTFLDVVKNFYVEHADRESVGAVLDFDNATKIVEFIESSIVPNITLYTDFIPAHPSVEFKQPVAFYNTSEKPLRFEVKDVNIEKSFRLHGNFYTYGEYNITEISNITISLSHCKGNIHMFDANTINIEKTIFTGDSGSVYFEDSSVFFMESNFENWRKEIIMSGSQITFINSRFEGVSKNLINLETTKYSTEEHVKVSEPLETSVGFVGCKILSSSGFLNSMISMRFVMSSTLISRSAELFHLNDSELLVNDIQVADSKDIFSIAKSSASIQDSTFANGMSQFNISDKCDVTMDNLTFEHMGNWAFSSEDSRIVAKRVNIFHSKNGANLLKGIGEFYHQDCLLSDIKHHNIIVGHGVKLVNLNDFNKESA